MIPTQAQLDLLFSDYQQLDTPERFGQFIYNRTGFELENSYNETDTEKAWYMLRKAVINNQFCPATDWISCSERLPPLYDNVLAIREDCWMTIDALQSMDSGTAKWANDEPVTHWMPLPNPPTSGL